MEHKMTKLQEKIINIETNEIILRDYTDDEMAQVEADKLIAAEKAAAAAIKEAEKQAVLEKLGLTADEIQALLS